MVGSISFFWTIRYNEFSFDVLGFINYLLGNGSYLYYLTILMLCYILIYFLPPKDKIYYILIGINIVSVLLTSFNILPKEVYKNKMIFTYLNPYLNILNWIGIFAIGVLIKRHNLLEKMQERLEKNWILILLAIAIIGIILILCKQTTSYWNLLTILIGIIGFVAVITISLKLTKINLLVDIGKKSFHIYLIHLLFLEKLNQIYTANSIFAIIRPVITVLIIYMLVLLGQKIAKLLNIERIYNIVLGVR